MINYDKYQLILSYKNIRINLIIKNRNKKNPTPMLLIIATMLSILAIFFTLILITLTCIGWFGLTNKIKQYTNRYLSRSFDQQYRNIDRVPLNTECYICLQRIKLPVITDCNHGCCAECLLRYVDEKGGRDVTCPACRQRIIVIFRQFDPTNSEQRAYQQKIAEYNFKNSEQPGIIRSIRQLPNIIRNAPSLVTSDGVRFLLNNPRVKVILIMLIYTLSPFDFLPEVFLGPFGFLDDGFVMLNLFREVSGLMIAYTQEEARRDRARLEEIRERRPV